MTDPLSKIMNVVMKLPCGYEASVTIDDAENEWDARIKATRAVPSGEVLRVVDETDM